MSQIISFDKGNMVVDIDVFAERLSMSTSDLKNSMQLLALQELLNEAGRLNAGEHFDKKSKIFPRPPIQDSHLVAAAKGFFSPSDS